MWSLMNISGKHLDVVVVDARTLMNLKNKHLSRYPCRHKLTLGKLKNETRERAFGAFANMRLVSLTDRSSWGCPSLKTVQQY